MPTLTPEKGFPEPTQPWEECSICQAAKYSLRKGVFANGDPLWFCPWCDRTDIMANRHAGHELTDGADGG